jgi:Fe-S oxidoreductase
MKFRIKKGQEEYAQCCGSGGGQGQGQGEEKHAAMVGKAG